MIALGYEVAIEDGRQWITGIRLGTTEATHVYRLDAPLEDTAANRPKPLAEWDEAGRAGELVEL